MKLPHVQYLAIGFALIAAVLYSISTPISKLLLNEISPAFLASLLYLGAGIGMLAVSFIQKLWQPKELREAKLSKEDLPYVIGMILLDIAAPILLMFGLFMTTAANAALLNNFEIVATSLIALLIFREAIDKRLWFSIILIVIASVILTVEDFSSFSFSTGSIFVLLACICWGFENNCTRMLSLKDPVEIVVIKGFGAGLGALIIAYFIGGISGSFFGIGSALLLGFFAFGLSIYFYVLAQRHLGAARTSAFYAAAPFIGVALSFAIFKTELNLSFAAAVLIMILGAYFAASGGHKHKHFHSAVTHEHLHSHDDEHHLHSHESEVSHSHVHTHEEVEHSHSHTSDMHHGHEHEKKAL